MESPVLISLPHGLSRSTHERVTQLFFERFNAAAVSIIERPLSQLYAANALSGLIIDIGDEQTDVTPVYECAILNSCCDSMPVGLKDCEAYLAHLFRTNPLNFQPSVVNTLSPPEEPLDQDALDQQLLELARQVWQEGLVKIAEAEAIVGEEEEGVTNIAAVLAEHGATLDDVVKSTVHLEHSDRDFAACNEVYAKHFTAPYPVRTTVQSHLAGILVEIDVVALLPQE